MLKCQKKKNLWRPSWILAAISQSILTKFGRHKKKIHFSTNVLLCEVFKCQYFWSYSYFTKNCSIDQIFFHRLITFQLRFFCSLRSIQMSIFLELFMKNSFLTIYIHISKGRNSVKKLSIDQFFFYRFKTFQLSFCSLSLITFQKIMKRKCQKTEFRGGHLRFLAAILD